MSPPSPRPFTTQPLVDLVLDPREPAYEAAARRRRPGAPRAWYDRPAVAAGCLVIGFLLAVAWVHAHRGAPVAATVHDRLLARVHAAQRAADDLAGEDARLGAEADRARNAALPGSSVLRQNLERSQLVAGTVAAHGPGIQVRLSEPTSPAPAPTDLPARADPTPSAGSHILRDRDIRSVVNTLWASGAEAIAVNGIRLTPTSAIRFAGDAVLVDFRPIRSPYVVDAIGEPDALVTGFAASDVASRYQTLSSGRGIGFSFDVQDRVDLPAAPAEVPRYATVPGPHR